MTQRADIVERLRKLDATASGVGVWNSLIFADAADEIERLRAAKTAALKIADERSKENVALRAALQQARDTAEADGLVEWAEFFGRALTNEQSTTDRPIRDGG